MFAFITPGAFDLRGLTTFGLSAKDSDSAIGQFGTGLKYAIAGILRRGETVSLHTQGTRYDFFTKAESFRGKEFQAIFMRSARDEIEPLEIELPFTTALGKHWEAWMIWRELESNTRDEGGQVKQVSADWLFESDSQTVILVNGLTEAWAERDTIFLNSPIVASCDKFTLHARPSEYMYCKGVRVAKLFDQSPHTINMQHAELTEERTLKSEYSTYWDVAYGIMQSTNRPMIEAYLRGAKSLAELPFLSGSWWSHTAKSILDEMHKAGTLSDKAETAWYELFGKNQQFIEAPLSPRHSTMLATATDFLVAAGLMERDRFPVKVSLNLGTTDKVQVLGRAKDGTIWLAAPVFEQGMKQVAATLFEEYLHLTSGLADCSYGMQNHLFNLILTQAEECLGRFL